MDASVIWAPTEIEIGRIVWSWREHDRRLILRFGRDVEQITLRIAPHCVELGCEQHIRHLPYDPTKSDGAAIVLGLLQGPVREHQPNNPYASVITGTMRGVSAFSVSENLRILSVMAGGVVSVTPV